MSMVSNKISKRGSEFHTLIFRGGCARGIWGQAKQFPSYVLVFFLVALGMGFLKDGKDPHQPPQYTHHAPTPPWNNISVRQQDCRLQGGMLSRRTGASHLYRLQYVREAFWPPSLSRFSPSADPTIAGWSPLSSEAARAVGVSWNIKLTLPLADSVHHSSLWKNTQEQLEKSSISSTRCRTF